MPFDATVGGVNANSFLTVSEATVLLAGRLDTEPWYASAADDLLTLTARREAALCWATTLLVTQTTWYGTPTTTTQALPFPMTGLVDARGRPIESATMPLAVQQATAVYALALLRDTSERAAVGSDAGVKSKRFGATTIVFRDVAPVPVHARGIPREVRLLLRDYGTMAGSVMVPVVRA